MKISYRTIAFIFFIFFTGKSFSLPRFAISSGGSCIDCHINPTGGEMRNDKGWNMSRKYLSMTASDEDFKMSNKIGDNIRFGLDIRGQLLGTLGKMKKIDFQSMSGVIYTNIDLTEKMNVFAKYDYVNTVWEGFGVAHVLPNNGYFKGGVFVPNFGIRLDDHTAYTRGGDLGFITNQKIGFPFDPYYTESGIEMGVYISDFAFFTASVGRPNKQQLLSNDPSYTARLQFNPSIGENLNLLFGGSWHQLRISPQIVQGNFSGSISDLYGPFVGIGFGNLTLLAEYDLGKSYLKTDSLSNALMVEASYSIMKGLDAVVRYDRFDPNTKRTNDDLSRIVIGFDIFPYPFMNIVPQYRFQMEHPSIKNDAFVVQFHLFY
jgi:hypothetical protein